MGTPTKVSALTNTIPKSCVDVKCDCNTMWSFAQQFSTKRLCVGTGKNTGKLVAHYAVRARRIAATYARFYLETEEGGDPKKIGRYYWMALGAFASKTVACTFDAWQVRMMSAGIDTIWQGLGKGNFWLFCDISGWHWYHNVHPSSFWDCFEKRNATRFATPVRAQIHLLPWSAKALPTINQFIPSQRITDGFKKVREFENQTDQEARREIQFAHLMEVAWHEQEIILQPLIYNDPAFAFWVKQQRAWYASWASPALKLVFTHQCDHKREEVVSVAPKGTALEDLTSRMSWIKKVAEQFHGLMNEKQEFMETALGLMAGWVELSDKE